MPAPHHADAWAENLRRVALATLADDPVTLSDPIGARDAYASGFRDETGARPSVVAPFLADLLALDAPEPPPGVTPDVMLWVRLARRRHDAGGLLAESGDPLLGESADHGAIEVRTESELIALHALSEIASRSNDPALHERCLRAARWHLDEIQPDNATNHPWAIQVFVRMAHDASSDVSDAARIHAQTMLHNCQISLGRPDRLSACILLHASCSLERHGAV